MNMDRRWTTDLVPGRTAQARAAEVRDVTCESRWLRVDTHASGRVCVDGEIDLLGTRWLQTAFHRVLASGARLELDLSRVDAIGSAGVGELLHLDQALDGRVVIVAASPVVARVLEATGLAPRFLGCGGSSRG